MTGSITSGMTRTVEFSPSHPVAPDPGAYTVLVIDSGEAFRTGPSAGP